MRVLEWMAQHGHIPEFLPGGRADQSRAAGRRGQDRPAWQPERAHRGAGHPGPRGLSGAGGQPGAPADPGARRAARRDGWTSGTDWFEPTSLQVTSVDVGNGDQPGARHARPARLNIRFNDRHTGATLSGWLRDGAGPRTPTAPAWTSRCQRGGVPDRAPARSHGSRLVGGHRRVSPGLQPRLDTGGGTSDARFIARHCPVAEFGLVGSTMHMADENVPVADLHALTDVYRAVLRAFAAMKPPGTPGPPPGKALADGHRAARHRPGRARAQGRAAAVRRARRGAARRVGPAGRVPVGGWRSSACSSGSRDAVEYVAVLATVVAAGPAGVLVRDRPAVGPHPTEWFRFATAFCWCQWAGADGAGRR